ncbi:hypothetical protein EDD85DRAFT_962171 [Armillaria nabsnona]|nr:hypothetical protein EDD85DRAFT_962171 [Armillaria nabsnona]
MATRLVLPTAEALDSGRRIECISEETGSRNDEKETLLSQHDRGPPHSLINSHDTHHGDVQFTKVPISIQRPRNETQDKENIPTLQTRPAGSQSFGCLRMGARTVISVWNFFSKIFVSVAPPSYMSVCRPSIIHFDPSLSSLLAATQGDDTTFSGSMGPKLTVLCPGFFALVLVLPGVYASLRGQYYRRSDQYP